MLLYLVRHGQSTDNAGIERTIENPESDLGRQHALESPLTELGQHQAERAGEWLAGRGIASLYASPMVRALQTGEILARHLSLELNAHAPLCELRDRAEFRGLPRSEIARLFPGCILSEEITEAGWWNAPVEDDAASHRRAEEAAAFLRARHAHSEDHVAVVTHGLFGSSLLSAFLEMPPRGYKSFLMYNTGISALEITPATTRLYLHNFIGHLTREMLT